jgi:polyisoprenoid-binding protein YceI
MKKYLALLTLASFAFLAQGCANPADNKPHATVSEATQPSDASKTAGAETLPITADNSKIEFVGSKVTGSHNGSFKQFSGTIELAKEGIDKSRVTIDVDVNSIVTDADGLTTHLKTADFFDVAKYPKATFTSTKIEPASTAGATHTVTGNLDMRGAKKSISFPASIQVAPEAVTVNAEFAINRRDFGINYAGKANDLIRDEVVMKLSVKAPRK